MLACSLLAPCLRVGRKNTQWEWVFERRGENWELRIENWELGIKNFSLRSRFLLCSAIWVNSIALAYRKNWKFESLQLRKFASSQIKNILIFFRTFNYSIKKLKESQVIVTLLGEIISCNIILLLLLFSSMFRFRHTLICKHLH